MLKISFGKFVISFMIFMIVALAEIKSKAFLGDKYEVSMH